MTSKSYTHRWCAVKGDTSWTFTTEEAAETKALHVSRDEQADVYELVDSAWVWRSCFLTIPAKSEAA
ncbi:MAG TPA: hypothetical protein VGF33_07715 [Caulobacteraceae bacterium]|jgi:hypothetical protein